MLCPGREDEESEGAVLWSPAELLEPALRTAIVEEMGIKPRLAFGPLRSAISGRRVSPPLFESMELLGKSSSLARLRSLRERLASQG